MIHITCIKWGTKFRPDYVNKLFRGIRKNTSKELLFTCFTDNDSNLDTKIDIRPLPTNLGTWFNKVALYNQDHYNSDDQIFYFDLDTVVVGNLDEIFEYEGDFIILRDFYRANGFGSGLMSWRPAAVNHMWTNFPQGYKNRLGDQGWPEEQYPTAAIWQEQFPNKIISYKVHVKGKGRLLQRHYTNHPGSLDTASIVCFHGKPLPHNVPTKWMMDNWHLI